MINFLINFSFSPFQDNELDKHRTEISTLNNNLKDKIKLLDEAKMEYCQLIEDKDNLEALLNEKLTVLLNRVSLIVY